jgi:phospholipid/cholesterol/gamma-HCH transport system permease protein
MAVRARLVELIGSAWPIVLLVHFSMGSFLAMQAFFGATFREAAGAVVGIGLTRNLAPLLTGFIVSGLLAALVVGGLRATAHGRMTGDPIPDQVPEPGRTAAEWILAAMLVGPALAAWGVASGIVSGLLVARSLLGVPPGLFLNTFAQMVRPIDGVGLGVKGAAFAALGALFACHEGLRRADEDVARSAGRAMCLSAAAILLLNSVWFSLVYLSGHPFGPSLAWE